MTVKEDQGVREMLETLVRAFVSDPQSVEVAQVRKSDSIVLELKVDAQDLGKVIGRQGRTARALRSLVSLAGEKVGKRHHLQILDQS
jgi:predicted RNA-binding protein YlqC (UPF0109 family)